MVDFVECASCHRNAAAGLTWCPFCGEELVAAAESATEDVDDGAFDELVPDEGEPWADEGEPWADEPEPWADEPEPWADEAEPIDDEAAGDTCVSCGRPIDHRLRWCPHCGTERTAPETAPAEPALPVPDLGELPLPPESFEVPPADPGEIPDLPPPPPRRRGDSPLGVETARTLPDLEAEARRVRRSQVAGMVMSIVLIVGSVAFVVFLLVSLLGGDDEGDAGPGTQGTAPSEVFTTFTPVVGDCVGYAADGEITEEPCDEPHHGEIFAAPVYSPTDATYPGDEAINGYTIDRCFAGFAGYVGVDYYASGLTFTYVTPNAQGWADGSRRMLCILEDPFGGTIDAVLRNSGGVDHPGHVPFSVLTAGTCWDFTEDTTELVPVVDCATPHDAETFAAFDYPATDFPGDAPAQELGAQECSRRLADYAGDVDDAVDYWAATPTAFDWPLGYRVVVCTAFRTDGAKLTGSIAG